MIILLYHGVTSVSYTGVRNCNGKHIPERLFLEQMKILKKNYHLLSINDIVEYTRHGMALPPNAVVVTFDDGFRNNFENAAPILTDLKIPTTFYISAGMINTNLIFWVDKLELAFTHSKKKILELKISNLNKTYSLSTIESRISALEEVKMICKQTPLQQRHALVDEVLALLDVDPYDFVSDDNLAMDWRELRTLSDQPLFEIGGHNMYHDVFTSLNEEDLQLEVSLTIDLLRYHLKKKIIHYSYPEGGSKHFDKKCIEILKSSGIVCCPTAIDGVNEDVQFEDLFYLKRIMPYFKNRQFPCQ